MQIAIIGLGRMGAGIANRLMNHGHDVVAFDQDPKAVAKVAEKGAVGVQALADVIGKMATPRHIWVMLPAGKITEDTVEKLLPGLGKGDAVIDGGNSLYMDDITPRQGAEARTGIHYVDVGTSGGDARSRARLLP